MKYLAFAIASIVSASHLDDLESIRNFKFDHVSFKTKKDCALDSYPEIKQFLEVESAHYPEMSTLVASEGQSRLDLYNEGKVVDTIHIYKWDIQAIRDLLA